MDPDANLAEQRRLVAKMYQDVIPDPSDAERLAELVDALDGWLSQGGFLPRAWKERRR